MILALTSDWKILKSIHIRENSGYNLAIQIQQNSLTISLETRLRPPLGSGKEKETARLQPFAGNEQACLELHTKDPKRASKEKREDGQTRDQKSHLVAGTLKEHMHGEIPKGKPTFATKIYAHRPTPPRRNGHTNYRQSIDSIHLQTRNIFLSGENGTPSEVLSPNMDRTTYTANLSRILQSKTHHASTIQQSPLCNHRTNDAF